MNTEVEDDVVSTADFGANAALPAGCTDRAGANAASKGADPRAGHRRAEAAGRPWRSALYAAADRPDGRADRALPRPGPQPGADGRDLPAAGGRGGAMAEGARRPQGRCAGAGIGAAALGPQRQGARRLPADRRDDERAYRVDASARRCLCHPAGGGHGARSGAAAPGDEIRQAEAGEAPDRTRAGTRHRDHLGRTGPGLCAGLQSDRRLWPVAGPGIPAGVPAAAAGLRRRDDRTRFRGQRRLRHRQAAMGLERAGLARQSDHREHRRVHPNHAQC